MEVTAATVTGVLTALGVGLLIGLERERRKGVRGSGAAGVRTHSLLALAGAMAALTGDAVVVAGAAVVGALAIVSYLRTAPRDPGLTGEVAMLLSYLLGALAVRHAGLAAGVGVVVATLLALRNRLHRLSRDLLTEGEVRDLLLLAGAALVVWPLLPDRTVDPWGVLNPSSVWRFVVLVLAVGAAGHVALRVVGARRGLPVAGFLAGFASSTAATAGFGQQGRADPSLARPAASATLLANLASLVLFGVIVGAGAPTLLAEAGPALAAAALVLLVGGLVGLRGGATAQTAPGEPPTRAFRLHHALGLGLVIVVVLLLSGWLTEVVGEGAALLTAALAALVDLQAAAVTVAQLTATGRISVASAGWGLVVLLAAGGLVKTVLAFVAGGRRFGLRVGVGLAASVAAAAVVMLV